MSAKEEPDSSLPPAMDGLLRVHKRLIDGSEGDSANPHPGTGGKISTRLLVAATQAGSLIGKQGATVKAIQEESNSIVRVLGSGCTFPNDILGGLLKYFSVSAYHFLCNFCSHILSFQFISLSSLFM